MPRYPVTGRGGGGGGNGRYRPSNKKTASSSSETHNRNGYGGTRIVVVIRRLAFREIRCMDESLLLDPSPRPLVPTNSHSRHYPTIPLALQNQKLSRKERRDSIVEKLQLVRVVYSSIIPQIPKIAACSPKIRHVVRGLVS